MKSHLMDGVHHRDRIKTIHEHLNKVPDDVLKLTQWERRFMQDLLKQAATSYNQEVVLLKIHRKLFE